jgi:hypothetical protein
MPETINVAMIGAQDANEIRNAWHRFEQEAGREFHLEWRDDIAVPEDYAIGDPSDLRYDLIRFVRERRGTLPHAPRLILITSLPFSDPEFARHPEGFYFYSADALPDHSVAIISTHAWTRIFPKGDQKFGLEGYLLAALAGMWLRQKTSLRFHAAARRCFFDAHSERPQDIAKFQGELCPECRMEMECNELGRTITIPQLGALYRVFRHSVGRKTCFLAMPFNSAFDSVAKAIEEALEPTWEVVRSDKLVSPPTLTDRILLWILASDLVIADITDQRPNVMYELGMARGYGRRAIIISQHKKLPFDLATTERIEYKLRKLSKLKELLRRHAPELSVTDQPAVVGVVPAKREPVATIPRVVKRPRRSLAGP